MGGGDAKLRCYQLDDGGGGVCIDFWIIFIRKCWPLLLTAHEVVNDGVDGAVEIAEPVGDEGGRHRVIILRQFDCVSALPRICANVQIT